MYWDSNYTLALIANTQVKRKYFKTVIRYTLVDILGSFPTVS